MLYFSIIDKLCKKQGGEKYGNIKGRKLKLYRWSLSLTLTSASLYYVSMKQL